MNGRAYDPELGRFLSVDPFLQFPENSQSLNPYSYILNNPLSGTDPTGYTVQQASGRDRRSRGATTIQIGGQQGSGQLTVIEPTITPVFGSPESLNNFIGGKSKDEIAALGGGERPWVISISTTGKLASFSVTSVKKTEGRIVNTINDGRSETHLSENQIAEATALINIAIDKGSFEISGSREELVERLDNLIAPISEKFDIEIGFQIYEVEGSGDFFASEIYTDFLSGAISNKTADRFFIPGLGKQLAGDFHSHGGELKAGSEFFSGKDSDIGRASILALRSGHENFQSFISTPEGALKVFDASKFQNAAKKANQKRSGDGAFVDYRSFVRTLREAR